jgi:hypothetical protein
LPAILAPVHELARPQWPTLAPEKDLSKMLVKNKLVPKMLLQFENVGENITKNVEKMLQHF